MAEVKSALLFLLQSVVVGLAVAFVVVLVRPELLPSLRSPEASAPASYADAVEASAPSVVTVITSRLVPGDPDASGRSRFRVNRSFASAVMIDPEGYLVTNWHVVVEAAEIQVQLGDGGFVAAEVVGLDAETDLALLKIETRSAPAIGLGSSSQLRIGDVVLAIGNPYGLTKSVTQGIVSATGRAALELATFEDFIQTDAAINAGNSGGALVNTNGELVGINTAVLTQDIATEGIGFAIPVDLVRGVVEELKKHGRVIRGYLGLLPDDLTTAERAQMGLDNDRGILITEVFAGGPAERAGLRQNDILLSINGEPILQRRQALLIAARSKPGDEIEVLAWRDGEQFRTTVTASERPRQQP
ncbi:MAG: trypsin-like serine protease [Gammaproteobacteria bacterium]|jgi:serine peptidase DegS|nr:trypsin-like serine protease [Gammaproteobacteria bacterium]